MGVGTFEANICMLNSSAATPDATHASYDCQAAIGTPIKFTKSFPAKARARANVPTPIITLYISTLKKCIKTYEINDHKTEL